MSDETRPRPVIAFEASSGTVSCLFDPTSPRAITVSATTSGGARQEYPMSRRQAVNTFLALGRVIRAMREDGELPEKYISLLDRGAVPFRRFAVQPASIQPGGRANG